MNDRDQDRLLGEILAGDELAEFRQSTLERGLVSLRQRQRRRRAVRLGTLASLPVLLAVGFLCHQISERDNGQIALSDPSIKEDAPPKPVATAVRFITDEELFALFPDRAMALVGKPGRQQLIFFDTQVQPGRSRSDSAEN